MGSGQHSTSKWESKIPASHRVVLRVTATAASVAAGGPGGGGGGGGCGYIRRCRQGKRLHRETGNCMVGNSGGSDVFV